MALSQKEGIFCEKLYMGNTVYQLCEFPIGGVTVSRVCLWIFERRYAGMASEFIQCRFVCNLSYCNHGELVFDLVISVVAGRFVCCRIVV